MSAELQEALTALANLLGAPFEHPKPLQPVAGPSNSRESTGAHRTSLIGPSAGGTASGSRKASGTSFKPETAEERKRSNVGVVDENKREVWLEVSDQVIEALEIDYRRATEERVRPGIFTELHCWDNWLTRTGRSETTARQQLCGPTLASFRTRSTARTTLASSSLPA